MNSLIVTGAENNKNKVAYSKIKASIIRNEFAPGTLLVERQISEQLNISRTPVREALRKLAGEGMVEFIPNKGVFVSRIRIEDIVEIYELREALDGMAVRLCTQRMTEDVMAGLDQNIMNQAEALKGGDYFKFIDYDMDFHSIYIKGAGNLRLEEFLKAIIDQINRLANTSIGDMDRARISMEQHRKLLETMKRKDAVMAETLIKEHMINIKEYYISKFLYK